MIEYFGPLVTVGRWMKSLFMWIRKKPEGPAPVILEICSLPTPKNPANEHRRIKVCNLLPDRTIRFGARLDAVVPPIKHDLPVRLQLTHAQNPREEADIPGGETHDVDVFCNVPGIGLGLLLATFDCVANNRPFFIEKKRYQIWISVFTVAGSAVQGPVVSHSFYIIPQTDGSIIFGDAGTQIRPTQHKPSKSGGQRPEQPP